MIKHLHGLNVDLVRANLKLQESEITLIGSGALMLETASAVSLLGVEQIHVITWDEEQLSSLQNGKLAFRTTIIQNTDELESVILTPSLVVLLHDTEERGYAIELNRICQKRSLPWMCISSQGFHTEIGPFIIPGDTACFECYTQRKQAYDNLTTHEKLTITDQSNPVGTAFSANLAAMEVLKFLLLEFTKVFPTSVGKVLTFDWFHSDVQSVPVLKLPRCKVCGAAHHQPTVRYWIQEPEGISAHVQTTSVVKSME